MTGLAEGGIRPRGVRMRILGQLAVWRDGTPVPLGPLGQRTVLGLLGLHPNAALHRDSIIDALWENKPPASALVIVQSYVSRIRSALEPDRRARTRTGLLVSNGVSYSLRFADDQLDALSFSRLVGTARRQVADGQVSSACEGYERALGLWLGDPLPDIEPLRGHPAVAELVRRRAAVVVEYADAAFGIGLHERVVPHLVALAGREPLNEPAHARLMFALAGSGRQADALDVFEAVRGRLDEQLGVRPGPELAEAQVRVLRQEVPAVAGRVPSPGDVLPVCQLPSAEPDFTGRAEACEWLVRAVGAAPESVAVPVAVVSGPPGVGKTVLALQVAHAVRRSFPDGQLWVQLAGASARPREPGEVLGELLRSLGVHGSVIPGGTDERAALFRSRVAGRRLLLVADDAGSVGQVRPLLPGTGGCAVIVTSRVSLAGLGGAVLLPLGTLPPGEAAVMLTGIVGERRAAAEPEAVGELARACGFLPLALRIAGAKLAARPSWPVSVMVRKVADERRRLDELAAGDLAVRSSLALSYAALGERAQRAFRLLGLVGPLDVAEWVITALLGVPDAAGVVAELADKSLLTALGPDAAGEPRYRLHDLLRDYAAERLADEPPPERDKALERALTGWLELAASADDALPTEPFFGPMAPQAAGEILPVALIRRLTADPLAWFNSERLNLVTIIDRACAGKHHQLASQIAFRLGAFHYQQSRYDDAIRIWQVIADSACQAQDSRTAARAWLRLAAAQYLNGFAVDGLDMASRSVAAFERLGDEESLAYGLYWRSCCAWDLDSFDESRRDAERGIMLARQNADRYSELLNLRILGASMARSGDPREGLAACEKAMAIAEELGNARYLAYTVTYVAYACILAGEYDRALTLCQSYLDLAMESGEVRRQAMGLGLLGDAYHGLGRYREAADALTRALETTKAAMMHRHHGLCLLKLGYAYEAMGQPSRALTYYEQGQASFAELNLPRYEERARQAAQRCQA